MNEPSIHNNKTRKIAMNSSQRTLMTRKLQERKETTVGLENFTTEKVNEYVFSTIVDSFHELNIHDWVV